MKLPFYFSLVLILPMWFSDAVQAEGPQPNILWVITDDQRPDSIAAFNHIRRGDAGSPLGNVLSPNIDRLAAMGTTFINTFNQNPSCSPSRTIAHRPLLAPDRRLWI